MNAGSKLKDLISRAEKAGVDPKPGLDTKQVLHDRDEFEQAIGILEKHILTQIEDGIIPTFPLQNVRLFEAELLSNGEDGPNKDVVQGLIARFAKNGLKPSFQKKEGGADGEPYFEITVVPA